MVVIEQPIPTVTEIRLPATPDQKLVNRTADLLEKYGWCTGTFLNGDGHMCLIGGLRAAYYDSSSEFSVEDSPDDQVYRDALVRLARAVGIIHDDVDCGCADCMETPLIDWNDSHDMRHDRDQVIAKIREAAVA